MMNYRVLGRKHPITKKVKYYPALVPATPMTLKHVISRIEKKCTLASADVKAVVDALETELIDILMLGQSVRLGDLGSFHLTLRSSGSATKEEVSAENIKSVHIVFLPSGTLRRAMSVKKGVVRFSKQAERPAIGQSGSGIGG